MWMEVVMDYFKALPRNSPEGCEEPSKIPFLGYSVHRTKFKHGNSRTEVITIIDRANLLCICMYICAYVRVSTCIRTHVLICLCVRIIFYVFISFHLELFNIV